LHQLGKEGDKIHLLAWRILDLMRQKIGGDLVRPVVTRFATSFLTLGRMHRHKQGLKNIVVSDE
jgi:hypothetical protein